MTVSETGQITWVEVGQLVVQAVGLLAIAIGAFRVIDERKNARLANERELAWRKTQFLAELARGFETDSRNQAALKLIDSDPDGVRRLLLSEPRTLDEEDLERLHCLDRYFDFLDRLYTFVFVTKTLDLRDVMVFSGYLDILDDGSLRDGVERRGYIDAALLYDAIGAWVEAYFNSGGPDRDLKAIVEQTHPSGSEK